jgi:hypothetical protein
MRGALSDEEPIVVMRVRPLKRDPPVPDHQHAVDVTVIAAGELAIQRLELARSEAQLFRR